MFIFPFRVYQIDDMQPDSHPGAVGYIPVYESIEALVDNHSDDCPSGSLDDDARVI